MSGYRYDYSNLSLGVNMNGLMIRDVPEGKQYAAQLRKLLDLEYETTPFVRGKPGEVEWILSMKERFVLAVQILAFTCQKQKWLKFYSSYKDEDEDRYVKKAQTTPSSNLGSYKASFNKAGKDGKEDAQRQVRDHILENMRTFGLCKEDIVDVMNKIQQGSGAFRDVVDPLIEDIRQKFKDQAREEARQASSRADAPQARPQAEMSGSTFTARQDLTLYPPLGLKMDGLMIRDIPAGEEYAAQLQKLLDFQAETKVTGKPGDAEWTKSMKERFTLAVQSMAFTLQESKWTQFHEELESKGEDKYVKKARQAVSRHLLSYKNSFSKLSKDGNVKEDAQRQVRDNLLGDMRTFGLCKEDIVDAMDKIQKGSGAYREVVDPLIKDIRKKFEDQAREEAGQASSQVQAPQARPQAQAPQARPQIDANQARPQAGAHQARPPADAHRARPQAEMGNEALATAAVGALRSSQSQQQRETDNRAGNDSTPNEALASAAVAALQSSSQSQRKRKRQQQQQRETANTDTAALAFTAVASLRSSQRQQQRETDAAEALAALRGGGQ